MPLDLKKYDQSSWLKADDLEDSERLTVTIYKVYEHTFPDRKVCPVLEFDELDKKLALNRTRIHKLLELLGDDSDKWIGNEIVLYRDEVNYDGKMVGSIAIAPVPKKKSNRDANDSDVVFGTR